MKTKMKVGIMQPYLFPYIGYWQLIGAVDKFVLLDDVNYIMRGYINRNSILVNGRPYRFTIPVKKASQERLIMDTQLSFTLEEKKKFLSTIRRAYKKAYHYGAVMPLIEEIIGNPEQDLTKFIRFSIEKIMGYLQIETELSVSSQMIKNNGLAGADRIIEICRRLGADEYVNPCGGRKLYSRESFIKNDMELYFLDTYSEKIIYDQGKEGFEPNMSIIDILFWNSVERIKGFLQEYKLSVK